MKKLYSIAILFIAAISLSVLSSCRFGCIKGSGHQVTENHKVSDFTRLDISGGFKINLKQDSSLTVSVTADDNLMKYIHINSDGDKLRIYSKKSICGSGELVLNIGVRNLEVIKTSGGINLATDGKLNTKDLRLELNGASKVDMDLNAANLFTEGSGSTDMTLKGQASSHKIEFAGSGKVKALDFVVGSYDIETTGASECSINVLKDLNVNTTGAADIKYRGNPTNVNTSKTGAANVTKIQ
ncbi:head GIN domain-containing protein [Mucilaginibacter sp. BT774]|uniref:head GIN domain-containing protein n=1 Tax=Mucilaginibacter sp. BT774 TaxID=3062276 RepID=UPI00267476CB|nr:head GIN domain-containing protein [Mucilaginibacter sp. BT774]MDO3628264.1 head GIN domain-containing protein [Mucilaginibacter sp. BT774]